MASVKEFISNKEYRGKFLKQIELELRDGPTEKNKVIIELDESKCLDLIDSDSDNEFEERYGDDFEVTDLHRYEYNIINALQYLINRNKKYKKQKIT